MTTHTDTHCPYCSLQCGMALTTAGGVQTTVVERPGFPVNRGALCGKGQSAAALLDRASRLTTPLVRDGGTLRAASWDDALDRIARSRRSSGPWRGWR
jgi:assimilatory nitrate reductase catalytic subunit